MYNVVLISTVQQSDVVWLESVGKLLIPPSPSPHLGNQKSVVCVCVFLLQACAKSLQLCPTLCDPMDCSPPRLLRP